MLRKLFKTGNSIVVSLPRDLIETLGISEGEDVSVELDKDNQQIVIRRAEYPIAGEISEEFAQQLAEFIDEYRPALEALAQ